MGAVGRAGRQLCATGEDQPVRTPLKRYLTSQGGFTLVEVIVASAIGTLLMVGLTSVVLTSVRAVTVANSRVEASSQIRSFEFFAYDDFARSAVPPSQACGNSPWTCPIVLNGLQAAAPNPDLASSLQVTYLWDSGRQVILRQVGANMATLVAIDVSSFSWYLQPYQGRNAVVVNLTVTVQSYSEYQALQFFPRLT